MSAVRPAIDRPLSRALDAAHALGRSIEEGSGRLSRELKQGMLEGIARGGVARAEPREAALAEFALRLARAPLAIRAAEIESLRGLASDEEILEAVLTAGAAVLRRTLSYGLGEQTPWAPFREPEPLPPPDGSPRPYLRAAAFKPGEFAPFDLLRERLGFVPALYKAQTLWPAALAAEIHAHREILFEEGSLPRRQKELVLLAVFGARLNTYGVALQSEILRTLGVPPEESDAIVSNFRASGLPDAEKALLDAAVTLSNPPEEPADPSQAAPELIAVAALGAFLSTVERGLNPKPDFRPRRDLVAEAAETERRREEEARRELEGPPDPDAEMVSAARRGDTAAFEGLVRRHQSRVYRTAAGLIGNPQDAEDCTQAVFVKMFRKIEDFSGASRFSTWLTRIAINEALEALRRRRPELRLDADDPSEPDFRPVSLTAWVDDPERLYAREEIRRIVHEKLSNLPDRYRIAVVLRDIEQLSTSEAAAALGIPVASLKTRLLRGRLMMREALAPLFDADAKGGGRV